MKKSRSSEAGVEETVDESEKTENDNNLASTSTSAPAYLHHLQK